MRVILHIGTNKTGTSSLQGYFATNPQPLQDANRIYPEYGRDPLYPAHHPIAKELAAFPHRADYVLSALEEEASLNDADGVFLSSEVFHTISPYSFSESLRRDGHEVEILCAVRNHIDYFSSWWRETVKSEISSFDLPNFLFLINKPYLPFLSIWIQCFGEDAFHLYGYNPDHTFAPGKSPSPIFDAILEDPAFHDSPDENPSISGNLLFLKRLVNNFIDRQTAERLAPELKALSYHRQEWSGPLHIPQDLCEMVDRIYAHDTLAIHEYFGVDLNSTLPYREGSLCPDLSTLRDDRNSVINISHAHDFEFGRLVNSYVGRC